MFRKNSADLQDSTPAFISVGTPRGDLLTNHRGTMFFTALAISEPGMGLQ